MDQRDFLVTKIVEMDDFMRKNLVTKLRDFEVQQDFLVTKVVEMDEYMRENMDTRLRKVEGQQDFLVTKVIGMDEYMRENMATKQELRDLENRTTTQIDGLAKMHEKLDHELVALRHHVDRLDVNIGRA